MQINEILSKMGGLGQIARELGVTESQAATGAAALVPAILGGFQRKQATEAASAGGLEGLLDRLGGGDLMDNVVSPEPTDVSRGNNVLGAIFGNKDGSRAVAQEASGKTGIEASTLKKMLPIVAMLVAGYMAKQRNKQPAGAGAGSGRSNPLESLLRMATR